MMPSFGLSSNFSKMLEKATSHLRLDPDWPTILSICDLIRQGDVSPKNALAAINKKITHENPHTAGFGLLVLESCVKNCGALIHNEVCTKQYMEQLKEIAKTTQQEPVRNKILELIQAWAYAFRDNPKYRAVQDTMRIMKAENFLFPDLQYSDAMFSADIAPEWVDGDKCHRCRESFTTFLRKHHCRACGQVFCNQCAGKFSVLPKYGIEKEVRVCITCYDQVNKPVVTTTPKDTDLPIEYLTSSLAQQQQVPPRKTDEELREEEELQIALALSQSEAEHKEKEKKRVTSAIMSNSTAFAKVNYSPPPSPSPSPKIQEEEEYDPDLAKYLDRQYWEQRQSALEEQTSRLNVTSPSAPNISSPMPQKVIAIKQQNGEIDPEMKNFVDALRSQVEIFVNRMKSDSSRGRSIANDSSVQTLFMNITALHSKLLRYIQDQEDKRVYYEGLQDKLTQIKDARCALDALREEHRLAVLQEKQEAERKKQLQMAQKLEIMRKKKREYLQYQRELALSRIQEQEREMQIRQEQQKQQYKMSGYSSVDFMGPPTQGSPVRQVQYSNPEAIYSSLPATNPATVYAYPPGTYQVPGNYMMQHPHQPQSIDPAAMPDTKPPTEESQGGQNHESLGRVTVSGPGLQIPVMGGPPSQPPLQGPPTTTHIPTTGQPVTHIPTSGMTATGQMMPPAPGQIPPQMMPNSQQMIHAQQRQQMMQAALARQMAMAGQIPGQPPHPLAASMPMPGPGQMVMPSSNGPMQAPAQQMQGSPQQIAGPQPQIPGQQQQMPGPPQQIPSQPQQMQGIPGAHMAAMPGVRMPPLTQAQLYHQQMQHQQQMAQQQQQQPSQQPPQQPQIQQQQQPPQQQQQQPPQQQPPQQQQPPPQQQQQSEPQPQPQEPIVTPMQEEERKEPEVAELITFD